MNYKKALGSARIALLSEAWGLLSQISNDRQYRNNRCIANSSSFSAYGGQVCNFFAVKKVE